VTQSARVQHSPEARGGASSLVPKLLWSLCGLAVLASIVYLCSSSAPASVWSQNYDPIGNWMVATLCAALPILVLLGTMAVLRLKAHYCALLGLATAFGVVTAVFHMPARLALSTTIYGIGYGLFPICWIVLPVIFLYKLTIRAGRFDALQQSLSNITADSRLQLLLIAFAFGAFFEGAAGFGTPVAVCGALLISLGFRPLQAAGLALLANTAPVAFGGLGIPVIALHGVTGLDVAALTKVIAALLVPFCILVPFWVIWAFAGFRRMIEVWPAILVAGVTFSGTQWAVATFHGPWLVDICASLATIVVMIGFLKVWQPKRVINALGEEIDPKAQIKLAQDGGTIFQAWLPWLILSLMVFLWGMPQFQDLFEKSTSLKFTIGGLHHLVQRMPPVTIKPVLESAVFQMNWFTSTGTGIFLAAVFAGLVMHLSPKIVFTVFFKTLFEIRYTILTIAAMLGLGFLTRYCGLDATMGLAFARTGSLYPFFAALVGWLGTASTGSDTSANVLFGNLQVMTARQIGVSPLLMASANSAGGVMAKMVAAQSIVVASTATQNYGKEGLVLRFTLVHSLALACLAGLLVYLMAWVYPFTLLMGH